MTNYYALIINDHGIQFVHTNVDMMAEMEVEFYETHDMTTISDTERGYDLMIFIKKKKKKKED